MIVRQLIRADVETLADLHAKALPRSLFTTLGQDALRRYYSYVESSPSETGWTAVDNGQIVGACILSRDPDSILSRFVRHAPVVFARELGGLILRDAELRRLLLARLREPTEATHSPEVTQIFTVATSRGQGVGTALLSQCEVTLRTWGETCYFVQTERDDNVAAIRFYQQSSFATIGEAQSFGRTFLVMKKDL